MELNRETSRPAELPCALTMAGSDSGGGAGIQADLKTFVALGVHGLSVITAVTAQNTRGVEAVFELPHEFVTKQLDVVMRDFKVEWAKTGMLSNSDIIKAVEIGAKRYDIRLVVDPVMTSTTGTPLLREEAFESLLRLLSRAEIVTPNVPEAEKLSGIKIKTLVDVRRAARRISKLGPGVVLIKGGHLRGEEVVDLVYIEGKFSEFRGPRVKSERTHGTGCSFSAALTAELAKGTSIMAAIERARMFVVSAIEGRSKVGHGATPVNPTAALFLDAEMGRVIRNVWAAAKLLVSEPKFSELLPEVGSNIAMALPGARQTSDVVGLSGRIVRVEGRPCLTGYPELGGSEHVANIVLAAMRHDPRIRAALNIKFSEEILRVVRRSRLSVSGFDRLKEPHGVKTMIWGTEHAIKKAGFVPNVIFDQGAVGKEAMVRLLGTSATEVANLALLIARMI
jgi:hydroxymethylpyrimidine kinase/phosphomethylpyrimidine kinase